MSFEDYIPEILILFVVAAAAFYVGFTPQF